MADIISLKDRLNAGRQSFANTVKAANRQASKAPASTGQAQAAKGEVLLFTGIFYERFEPLSTWSRVELPTGMPSLPAPANPA